MDEICLYLFLDDRLHNVPYVLILHIVENLIVTYHVLELLFERKSVEFSLLLLLNLLDFVLFGDKLIQQLLQVLDSLFLPVPQNEEHIGTLKDLYYFLDSQRFLPVVSPAIGVSEL